MTEADVVM
jgi:hypothetical protein